VALQGPRPVRRTARARSRARQITQHVVRITMKTRFVLCAMVVGAVLAGRPAAAQPVRPFLPPDFNPLAPDFNDKINEKVNESIEKAMEKAQTATSSSSVRVRVPPVPPMPPAPFGTADSLYENARNLIDRDRYDLAMRQ